MLALLVVLLVGRSGAGSTLAIAGADAVAVIDPGRHTLIAEIPVGSSPVARSTAGAGAVWVVECRRRDRLADRPAHAHGEPDDPRRQRAECRRGRARRRLGGQQRSTGRCRGSRRPPIRWSRPFAAGNSPSGVCVAAGAVWVASTYDRSIVRFDPVSERTTTVPLDDQPTQLACGGGSVWATSESAGTRDPGATGRPRRGGPPDRGRARPERRWHWGRGALWVANTGDGTVSRIDRPQRRADRGDPVGTGERPGQRRRRRGARLGRPTSARAPWPASTPRATPSSDAEDRQASAGPRRRRRSALGERPRERRAAPRRDAARRARLTEDGAGDRRPPGSGARLRRHGATLALTNDGLVAFRRVGGRQASTLVPDLAASVPRRPTGAAPTPSSCAAGSLLHGRGRAMPPTSAAGSSASCAQTGRPRRSTRRSVAPGAAWGAEAPCDLSAGIEVDDAAGTITFRLTRPGPGLPLQAGAAQRRRGAPGVGSVPRGAGARHRPVHGRPGSSARGPLRLVRNPRFRPVDGRPDGYPDAITIDCCAAPQRGAARGGAGPRGPHRRRLRLDPNWRPRRRDRDALRRPAAHHAGRAARSSPS